MYLYTLSLIIIFLFFCCCVQYRPVTVPSSMNRFCLENWVRWLVLFLRTGDWFCSFEWNWMIQTSSLLSSGSVICLVQHLNKVNSYIFHVTYEDSIRYCLGASVIGEQLSSESTCRWGANVGGEQVSVGSKCRKSKCPGSTCRGSNCLGCTFHGINLYTQQHIKDLTFRNSNSTRKSWASP